MPNEIMRPALENENIKEKVLEIPKGRKEYLKIEQDNHFGIIPAFRILSEIAKHFPENFKFNKITGAKFTLPTVDLNCLKYKTEEKENNITASSLLGDSEYITLFKATFSQDDNLAQKVKNIKNDLTKNTFADIEEIREILPQEGDLVMIDKICHLNKDKIVASRKINDLDCEEDYKFNKLRLIEMVAQTAEFHFFLKINKGVKNKQIATGKEVNMDFYPDIENIEKGDEIFIETTQNKEEKKQKKSRSEIYKKDGTVIAISSFLYNDSCSKSYLEKIIEKVKKRSE